MTDHHDPDDLASAHLDRATTPDEAARIAADPVLQARVDALRAVRAAVQQPVDADPEAREAALAAALAAFDEELAPSVARPATVTPIIPRRGLSPTARRVLGAAAVVAVLALLVPLLAQSTDDDSSGDATFEETGAAIGGADRATSDAGTAEDAAAATSTTDLAAARDLGAYDDLDALLDALARDSAGFTPPGGESGTGGPNQRSSPCPVTAATSGSDVGVAVVAGRNVVVAVLRSDKGFRLLVLDAETCEVLADRRP